MNCEEDREEIEIPERDVDADYELYAYRRQVEADLVTWRNEEKMR